jgi:HK97 family phage major capsid protein
VTKEELVQLIDDVLGEKLKDVLQQQSDNQQKWIEKILASQRQQEQKAEKPNVGRLIRALAAGKGDPQKAAAFAQKAWKDEAIVKALQTDEGEAGGYLVPEEYSSQLIEYLRPLAVVRRMNPVIIPMETGTMSMPAVTGGASAEYIGEGTNVPKSQPTFGQVKLTWKKLACLVPISNDLIRFSSPKADEVVRNDLVGAMAQREDAAFIRDDGNNDKPKGLLNWIATANKFEANETVSLANVTIDLAKAIYYLRKNETKFLNCGWILSPGSELYLKTVRDSNGNFAFKGEMDQGKLFGFPFGVTTQVPDNLGDGEDESEIYFVDFADAAIGESSRVEIEISSEAAYYDGSNVVSAFSLDQTVLRAIARHDFAMRRNTSGAVIQAVTWGSSIVS